MRLSRLNICRFPMEASLTALCSRASLPSTCVGLALEYQRTLAAKQATLGVSHAFQSALCLHLSAIQEGKAVDSKQMVKLAGAKSKPHYLSIYQNAEKILDLDQVSKVFWTEVSGPKLIFVRFCQFKRFVSSSGCPIWQRKPPRF